ncbi:protein YnfN [Escherichia coli]|nr:protein YnfN [Escherichia coli]
MKKIIVFFNSEPAVVVSAMTGVNTIMREYPNGEKNTPYCNGTAGFPSLTGDHKVIYVAADRHVTSEEILEAAIRLLS